MVVFFFKVAPTTEIYTLSLHDALPISRGAVVDIDVGEGGPMRLPRSPFRFSGAAAGTRTGRDRKSTRLNSSHVKISYAVFCLKKKKKKPSEKLANTSRRKLLKCD